MRSLVHYDLGEPLTAPPAPPAPSPLHPLNTRRPPAKKRKRNQRNPQGRQPAQPQKTPIQHWDDPGNTAVGVVYDEQEDSSTPANPVVESVKVPEGVDYAEEEEEEYDDEAMQGHDAVEQEEEEEEESRPLTHAEIWDDSALIDAWHSAEAEYEAYHGTSKAWKAEPVKKSPLWYNKPYTAPRKPNAGSNKTATLSRQGQEDGEPDTAPLDFDTFIPTHDPSLGVRSDGTNANPTTTPAQPFAPPPSTMMVSRDEAFNNALSAMYWSGYWVAVYHCQSQSSGSGNDALEEVVEEDEVETDEDEDEQDLVPAQR